MKVVLFIGVTVAGALHTMTSPEITSLYTYYTGVVFGGLGILTSALWS